MPCGGERTLMKPSIGACAEADQKPKSVDAPNVRTVFGARWAMGEGTVLTASIE